MKKTDSRVEEFIRVDHAGERGAVKIYEGQLLALNTIVKNDNLKKTIEDMKEHEIEHCQFFENEIKKRNIDLQSYKIIFILKDVDPKDPTEELSSILSNSEVNFEIEKIERILDSKNKSMNKN